MITKMPVLRALTHSTRLRVQAVKTAPVSTVLVARKPWPSVLTLGGIDFHNSTGVSVAECRHR